MSLPFAKRGPFTGLKASAFRRYALMEWAFVGVRNLRGSAAASAQNRLWSVALRLARLMHETNDTLSRISGREPAGGCERPVRFLQGDLWKGWDLVAACPDEVAALGVPLQWVRFRQRAIKRATARRTTVAPYGSREGWHPLEPTWLMLLSVFASKYKAPTPFLDRFEKTRVRCLMNVSRSSARRPSYSASRLHTDEAPSWNKHTALS
jgi:hypothetical protein